MFIFFFYLLLLFGHLYIIVIRIALIEIYELMNFNLIELIQPMLEDMYQ
jgi:hypothetical protein